MVKKFILPHGDQFVYVNSTRVPFKNFRCGRDGVLRRVDVGRIAGIGSLNNLKNEQDTFFLKFHNNNQTSAKYE